MKFSDAKNILQGSDTAATDYFKKTTSAELRKMYKPIIEKNMNEVGVVKIYNQIMTKYDTIPFKSKPNFSLVDYVTERAFNATFSVVAEEEKKSGETRLPEQRNCLDRYLDNIIFFLKHKINCVMVKTSRFSWGET